MQEQEKKVYKTLDMLSIPYYRCTHPAISSIDELEKHDVKGDDIVHCKNLFLRNSKGDKHYLVLTDKDLASREKITFHPNINTASITINYNDFQEYIKWCGNKVTYVDTE